MKSKTSRGFTLLELLVVIGIIGILSAIVLSNMSAAAKRGRDVERQSDLRNLQNAVEAYKKKNGVYPRVGAACPVLASGWAYDSTCDNYIEGLAPEFINRLPHDKARGTALGYSYAVDSTQSVYKIIAWGTVESETVTFGHSFRVCDPNQCSNQASTQACFPTSARNTKSFAVWGGFASNPVVTTGIICK